MVGRTHLIFLVECRTCWVVACILHFYVWVGRIRLTFVGEDTTCLAVAYALLHRDV